MEDSLRLPEPDTRLAVSYSYRDDSGMTVDHKMTIEGDNAESGAYMVSRFRQFLADVGYLLKVEPPVTVPKVAKEAVVLAFLSILTPLTPSLWGHQNRNMNRERTAVINYQLAVADPPIPILA
jgi:hypothetical protein